MFFSDRSFDHLEQERALAKIWRLLDQMNELVNWDMFLPVVEGQVDYGRWSGSVLPGEDPLWMLRMCVRQDLRGRSDGETSSRCPYEPHSGVRIKWRWSGVIQRRRRFWRGSLSNRSGASAGEKITFPSD